MNKFILAATLSLLSASFNAQALGNLANITVFDRIQNRALTVYKHNGHYYVAGQPGNAYQIHVENRQPDSIEAVISVDAINVITGKSASSQQSGYIFDAYNGYDIAGWRKSDSEIAGFYFTEIENSYAARTGRSGNVGVIGVDIYNKQPQLQYEPPMPTISRGDSEVTTQTAPSGQAQNESANADKAMSPKAESKKLGTGHGAIESSFVSQVEFARASTRPAEVITIFYDSYKNLVAQGVIRKPHYKKQLPRPFLDDNYGYVPDPY